MCAGLVLFEKTTKRYQQLGEFREAMEHMLVLADDILHH